MNTDVKFAIWCARKCLHLWDPPEEVKSWLADPKPEWAAEAARAAAAVAWSAKSAGAAGAAAWAASAATRAAEAAWAATRAAEAAERTALVLDTTAGQLRLDFMATWTDEQLAQASGDWIEPATAEIFERAAEAT